MNVMFNYLSICLLLLALSLESFADAATKAKASSKHSISASKPASVQKVLYVLDPNKVHLRMLLAKNGIGHVETFASFLHRSKSWYAMNGTFFSAYVDSKTERYPFGLMVQDGKVLRGGKNVSFVIDTDGKASIHRLKIVPTIRLTDAESALSYEFTPWNINHYYGDTNQQQWVILTPDFGKKVRFPNGVKVVVADGVITQITREAVSIPKNGWVYYDGNQTDDISSGVFKHFRIGDAAEYRVAYLDTDSNQELNNIQFAIGAGPWIVNQGNVTIDFDKDEFFDKKIRTLSGNRGFLGIRADGKIMIGYVSRATVRELAAYLRKQGAVEAMNMDGNASGAFAVNGKPKWNAGRELSNVLLIEKR